MTQLTTDNLKSRDASASKKHFSFESRQQWADADTLDGFPVYVEDALRLTLLQSILVISQDDDDCEY